MGGCGHQLDRMLASPHGGAHDMNYRVFALLGATIIAPLSPLSSHQLQPPPPLVQASANGGQETTVSTAQPQAGSGSLDDTGDEEEIVVRGSRPQGSVVGDIPPENTLDTRDVRTTGATSVTELLDAIGPQIGSVRGRAGGQPVLLLNGQRISSFRELRDIPSEAIQRVEILPEEVALKYGYRADQRVVNFVLRRRFRSIAAEVGGGGATDGGYATGHGGVTRFLVQRHGRTTLHLRALVNSMLAEDERHISLDSPPPGGTTEQQLAARSLIGSKHDIRASGTFNRQLSKNVWVTLNADLEHEEGRSLIGLNPSLLEPRARKTYNDTEHVGLILNGQTLSKWRWTVTGNADLAGALIRTDLSDPSFRRDRTHETTETADITATANGNLFNLPAGYASTTLTLGGNIQHLSSSRTLALAFSSNSLSRTSGQAGINLDLPISHRGRDFGALGNLTVNANAEVDQLSDFGTLTTIGAGLNWSPAALLNFIASWTREEGAPSINQLGDPVLDTPGSRIFDFTTGKTVLVDAITGGNPRLMADRRSVVKLSGNWQPFKNTGLRLRADYAHQIIARPISNISVTPQIEAALPHHFVRNSSGELTSVDLTPVNFDRSERDQLRIGFDFNQPLKSRRPSQSVIDQMRARFGSGMRRLQESPGNAPALGDKPQRGGGLPAFREGRSDSNRGRLQLSLTDTITLVDKVLISPGGSEIDYLHGDAAGSTGGTPEHNVQAQLGYFNNGFGARVSANWRSGTSVDTLTFSPLGTFDVRLFADLGDVPEIVLDHPWLRGTQFRFEFDNVFNARPKVRDAAGNVPLSYQPDLLDPLGRTIMISFRKLFQPSSASVRRPVKEETLRSQQQQSSP